MGEQALPKIVQQGEVRLWDGQVETEGIYPIHAAPDRIGCLVVGERLSGNLPALSCICQAASLR